MFPDEAKSKVIMSFLNSAFPDAEINSRIDIDTFSYIFSIDRRGILKILHIERSFVDDRESQSIARYLDINGIPKHLERDNVKNIFVSNKGISIDSL